jgi:hypothetical protein
VKLAGALKFEGGADADYLDLTNLRTGVIGSVDFVGGTGDDRLEVGALNLQVARNLAFTGDDGADAVSVEADGVIKGSVNFSLGGATSGVQSAELRGFAGLLYSLRVMGGLTVDATGEAATTDFLRITHVSVAKAASLAFGNGVSDVDIDNLNALDTLTIDTRGGADSVRIETDGVYGTSLFKKAATISLGEGDDALRIGEDSRNNRVMIMALLTVNGGAGINTANNIETDNRFGPAGSVVLNDIAG